jgi:hypothetical protein
MDHGRQYWVLAGIGLLTIAVIVLLVSPGMVFSPMVTVIGSDLNQSSSDQVSVTTTADLGSPEQMAAFPRDIGKWHGEDYDAEATARQLGARAVLIREYKPKTFSQPLYLTIVQSESSSSFHELDKYCYPDQGYDIEENSKDLLVVDNPTWTEGKSSIIIPLKKLVVTKDNSNGDIIERSVAIFFYIKGNQYYSDLVTMIEVQGLAPVSGPYDDTLNEEKSFMTQIVPLLFQPANGSEWNPLVLSLADKGIIGYTGIGVILLIPLAVIAYPFIRKRGGS